MDEPMRRMLCAGSQMEHGHKLGARIDGQPEPQDLLGVAQPGAQFVQLQMRQMEVAEAVLVQDLCVFPRVSEPHGEGGLAGLTAEGLDPLSRAMLAIPDEGMDLSIGNPEVLTLVVGTSKALGVYAFGSTSPAFHLTPGAYWRRSRSHIGGAEATEGAIKRGARLEQT